MISILCPTRKRPKNFVRFVDSLLATASKSDELELLVYIDDDDEESIPALQQVAEKINTNAVQGNKLIGSQMYNELGKMAQGDIIFFGADDVAFRTPEWDSLVKHCFELFEDKIMFVYGEDGFQKGRIGTHGFIHRYWMELLGYVLPPKLASAYTDEWVTELADRIGRKIYCSNLYIEHLHPAVGKATDDETYKKRIEIAGNLAEYYKSLEPDRIRDVEKLKQFIDLFK